jgi:citrate lyase subunit beta-like protein
MSIPSTILRRALLYVPSSSPRMLQKSLSLTTDNLTYDLEDSVTPSAKPAARSALVSHLSSLSSQSRPQGISEIAVRINDVNSGLALQDLQEILKIKDLDALVVPKVNSASDLHFVQDVIRHLLPERHPTSPSSSPSSSSSPSPSPSTSTSTSTSTTTSKNPIKILALIESARAIIDLPSICAATPYLDGLIFAAEDFALDLSLTRTPLLTEFLYARSAIATAARAFNLSSTIDLVCTTYKGEEGLKTLEEECRGGKGLGYNGKQCIHPSQVEVVQRAFAPGVEEVEWAVRVCVADEKAARGGRGAWTLDGKMIDAPVVGKARALVNKAERCGIDVAALREKWKDRDPE